MRLNQKLTPILAGRVIQAITQEERVAQVKFQDGSLMTIKLGGPLPTDYSRTAKIKVVRQSGTKMSWEFEGTTLTIPLAEATSSVLLRDAQGRLEYAD